MLDSIANFFNDLLQTLLDFLKSIVYTLFDMFKDVFYWLFESLIIAGKTLLAGVLGNPDFSMAQYFTALPADVRNVIALTGLPECILLIMVAIGLRLTLQLIPFVRFGS